ncbi:MAG: flagellar biosynthetic protein FliO [Gammaproteobacteria bacterium]|nr:flagellar biosynthetic protein FliO [Gammaproteobacteria bacterium]
MRAALLLLLLVMDQAVGAEVATQLPAVDAMSSAYLMKLMSALLFIIVLIFGLAWLMKKMQLTQHSSNGLIRIVSAISVGQRDRIALIQVGEEQILVAMTPGKIEKLHTLKTTLSVHRNESAPSSFAEKFNQLVGANKNHAD